ncbi:YsnF/AvaK domain-containing protein [Frondihabitans sp. VKM Ac-2883]|uniref:YsnF/AvaK domain-containing protein n=1 Tax=Frondihabitans sp. VKM Ac-2883 TaxID=2783823 RepID=UPI001889FDE1|nr:YsnF/AvaK domain-containing protein [Frondihabitans sp. VKM Ac-2883]MBF4575308.1 YsnF/AvaK domain-containing protein [Frondihabitans sp. VKM Ac-2883]
MTDAQSVPDLPGVDDDSGVHLTRLEERLSVSTLSVPKERVRVKKVIVTEERTVTVTVRREELRITREPLGENGYQELPNSRAESHDLDIVLHEEQIFIATEVVPVERVRIRVNTLVDDVRVTGDVLKERVDLITSSSREPWSVDGAHNS